MTCVLTTITTLRYYSFIPLTFFVIFILLVIVVFFFFNDTATTEIYTLSLHDALPIFDVVTAERHVRVVDDDAAEEVGAINRRVLRIVGVANARGEGERIGEAIGALAEDGPDRKSTRLNSSHPSISYAVFCLKKKKT